MNKVIDMNSKLQAKKEMEEMKRWKDFLFEQFADQSQDVMDQLLKAIRNKDQAAYRALVEPIIMKQAQKHAMKGGM